MSLLINLAGIAVIGLIVWWFWLNYLILRHHG